MHRAHRALRIFLTIQGCALLLVAFVLDDSSVFRGILPAQAALIGIGLSIGPIQYATRAIGSIVVVALFAVVVICLALQLPMGGLFGMHGFGWEFLMMTVRALLIGTFYWRPFLSNGYVLSTAGEPFAGHFLRFRLHHFLALMSLVALYFVVTTNLSGGPFYGLLLVVYVILLGFAYAIMDLCASLLALESSHTPGRVMAYMFGILLLSLAIAAHSYESTDRWASAKSTWIEALIEVAWLCVSLVTLRFIGFRLVKQPATSVAAPVTKSDVLKQSLRFSLKTFFVVLTLIAVWIGWNVSIVRKRDRLRAMIEDVPGAGAPMAFITYAEGDASASPQVKERIAPQVLEAFEIRNRGGRAIGPSQSTDLPLIRRWLGDEPVSLLLLNDNVDIKQFEAVFPEAMIVVRQSPKAKAAQ